MRTISKSSSKRIYSRKLNKSAAFDFQDVIALVTRLYRDVIIDKQFRPERAFAYVQDETEGLHHDDTFGMNAVVQTIIYMGGFRYGLDLSAGNHYAQDMLELLAGVYRKCRDQDLIEAGSSGDGLEQLRADIIFVKKRFLST